MDGELVAGRYRIDAELGRGASATVFGAYDLTLERPVALKVISSALASDPEFVARFEREGRLAARLDHPNIVTVYDVGAMDDGRPFIAMRLLEGEGLDAVIARRAPFSPAEVAGINEQLASALDYMHTRGLIHRDVKPSNVRIDAAGRATLTDFGIARALDSARVTLPGLTIGTPRYMSPEQVRGEDMTPATDIYSLAVMAYEMLAGRPPFEGDGTALMFKIVHEEPASPAIHNPRIPAALVPVMQRGLAKGVAQRWPTAGQFAAAFSSALSAVALTAVFPVQDGDTVVSPTQPSAPSSADVHDGQTVRAPQAPAASTPSSADVHDGQTVRAPQAPAASDPSAADVHDGQTVRAPPAAAASDPSAADVHDGQADRAPPAPPAQPAPPELAAAAPQPAVAEPPRVLMGLTPAGGDPGGAMRFTLSLANQAAAPLTLFLAGAEPTGVLQVAVQPSVLIGPGGVEQALVEVRQTGRDPAKRRRVPFQVTARTANGVQAGFATASVAPAAEQKGGGPRTLLMLGVGAAGIGALLVAGFLVLSGRDDTPQSSPTAGQGSTTATSPPATSVPVKSIPALARWDYSFKVENSTCSFGAKPGDAFTKPFRYSPADGGNVLKDGATVRVFSIADQDAELGRFTFRLKDFEFNYPVEGFGGVRGTATLRTSFADDGSIATATLVEEYGGSGCTIGARVGG